VNPKNGTEEFVKGASIQTGHAADEEILARMHQAYHRSAAAGPVASRVGYWDMVFASRLARFAAAGVILLAAVTLVGEFGQMLTGSSVAWAEVTQRFQSVPFFYASIYMKQDALEEPQQFELWMGKGGHARMRVGTQVIFGRDGRVTRAFDVRQRREVEADATAANIIGILGTSSEFSLETVIRSISGGKLVDVTPSVNPNATVGEDLAVFDAHSAVSPGWVRVYALRESRLPVGLRLWDPAEGFGVDVLITYAKEQRDVFFDPEAFAARLGEAKNSETALAYMFLEDAGGQNITPAGLADWYRQTPEHNGRREWKSNEE
jgi:hypothetical protein